MVTFDCPICGSKTTEIIYPDTLNGEMPCFNYDFSPKHSRSYSLGRCQDCGHVYASPRPKNLWQGYESVIDSVYLERKPERILTAEKVIKEILKNVPKGKLLDVGCATGDFLSVAKQFYEIEGVELSYWSSQIAKDQGFKIHTVILDDLKNDLSYDIITLWGVIEHLEFPKREIINLSRLLKKGGYVFLWTGDFDSLPSKLLGRKWWYHQGQHIQMFTSHSLKKVFNDTGFDFVKMMNYPYVLSMQSIHGSLKRYPFLNKVSKPILTHKYFSSKNLTISLPGEMFAVFHKRV